jgi:hypothetical protein
MQPGDALNVVAQVAVTLAGFAGIVVVFRPRSVHQWSALDRFRLRLLLANSALPLAYSLFGMLLLTIDPPPVAIWRWCSGVTVVSQFAFFMTVRGTSRLIPRAEFQSTSKTMYYSVGALAVIAMLLQLINIVFWNWFWPFFFALFVNLTAGLAQFIRMVLLAPQNGER